MLVLDSGHKSIEVVLDGAPSAELPWVTSWKDQAPNRPLAPGGTDGLTSSTTAVTIVPGPMGDGLSRELQFASVFNIANAARIVTIRLNNGTTTRKVIVVTLQVGDQLMYSDKAGWYTLDANGQVKQVLSTSVAGFTSLEPAKSQRTFRSSLTSPGTAFLTIADTGYFVYLGRTVTPTTPKYVECYLDVVGAGTTKVFEVALLSSPLAPNKAAGQTLTVLAGTATTDDMASGLGVKRNSSAFATIVPAGTHLWAGCRANNATGPTQPSLAGLMYDNLQGLVLVKTTCGSIIASATTIAAVLATAQTGAAPAVNCPDLQATLD